jgi:hypothetical protein
MHQKQYDKQFGKGYKRPGFSAGLLSFLVRVLPKIGSLRTLKFRVPTPAAEKLFEKSFDTVIVHYSANLNLLRHQNVHPQDLDYDTGKPTTDCEYSLADQTHCDWLLELKADKYSNVTTIIKNDIVNYFHLTPTTTKLFYSKDCSKFYQACNQILQINAIQ